MLSELSVSNRVTLSQADKARALSRNASPSTLSGDGDGLFELLRAGHLDLHFCHDIMSSIKI